MDCMTCGAQRSLQSLADGDLLQSLIYFPATIPLLLTFTLLLLHLKFNFSWGARALTYCFASAALLVLGNFIVHLYTGEVWHS